MFVCVVAFYLFLFLEHMKQIKLLALWLAKKVHVQCMNSNNDTCFIHWRKHAEILLYVFLLCIWYTFGTSVFLKVLLGYVVLDRVLILLHSTPPDQITEMIE